MKISVIALYLLFFAFSCYVGLDAVIADIRNPLPKFENRNEKSINTVPIIKTRKIV